jgi:hypothetical protein
MCTVTVCCSFLFIFSAVNPKDSAVNPKDRMFVSGPKWQQYLIIVTSGLILKDTFRSHWPRNLNVITRYRSFQVFVSVTFEMMFVLCPFSSFSKLWRDIA